MQRISQLFGFISLLFLCYIPLFSESTQDLMDMDLEDILEMNVTVFSVQGLTQRQTPGVVTLISQEEIRRSGARDLTDVLRLVPGFELGVDIQNAVSLGIRGIWAQEGKVLLMVDDMEMNEILFSCLALGDHFPIEQIQQIEIIRGPGTSFYGSNAELAVINIITKKALEINGVESFVKYGQSSEDANRRSFSLNYGQKIGATKLKALIHFGKSIRSDQMYTDIYGNQISMLKSSSIQPVFVRAGFDYKGLKGDILADNYLYEQQDALDEVLGQPVKVSFNTYSARLKYGIRLNNALTLTPTFLYFRQEPWKSSDQTAKDNDFYYYEIAERIKPSLVLSGEIAENLQFIAGSEFIFDRAKVSDETPIEQYFSDGKTHISNSRFAVYAQAFYTKGKTIPSFGIRYDRHNVSGDDFVPWLGISHSQGPWTFKGLIGQTFRAPAMENLNINQDLTPEKTTTGEIEIGFQVRENWICLLDVYRTYIKGPIIYYYDPVTDEELYGNYQSLGSKGVELESRSRWRSGYLNVSFSFYRPLEKIASYSVEDHSDVFLGFPAYKMAVNSSLSIGAGLNISPTLVWTSKKYGYFSSDADGNFLLREYGPALMANLYLYHDRLFGTRLEAGVGVYNLFDEKNPILQPYDSGHAPLPILSREIVMNLKYHWKW